MHQEFPSGEGGRAQNVSHFGSNLGSGAQISSARISREVPITAAIYNSNLVKLPSQAGPCQGALIQSISDP